MKLQGAEKFTDEERAGLTDEELAALEGDDDSTESLQSIVEDEDDDPAADAAAKAKAKDEAEAKAKTDADAKAKEDAAAAAKEKRESELAAMSEEERTKALEADATAREAAEQAKKDAEARQGAEKARATDDDELDEPFVPEFTAKAPENYDARMAELAKKDAADLAEFKDDKIEIDVFLTRQSETQAQRAALQAEKLKADIASESTEQLADQQWQWECRRFLKNTAKHEGLDYKAEANKHLFAEFDSQVRILAGNRANDGKPGEWFLAEAHKRVKAIHNVGKTALGKENDVEAARKEKEEAERKAKEKAIAARGKDKSKLPTDLGKVPAAGANDVGKDGEGEFGHLDGLTGMDLEVAVAAMTPDQQDRWARM